MRGFRGFAEKALECLEKALSHLSSSLQRAIDIFCFNSFASTEKTKNMTEGTTAAAGSCVV